MASSPKQKLIAIVAGVGPGTGAAVARRFAAAYPVVLLARQAASYEGLAREINGAGGQAVGISADVADARSVERAVGQIKREFGDGVGAAAAIFNASSRPVRKPFLELTEAEFEAGQQVSVRGAFLFAQATLPLLLKSLEENNANPPHPPTLLFTGATASLRGGAQLASFAAGKNAQRALAQSLAREFGPRGVHVGHAVVDGVIDTPATAAWLSDAGPDAKLSADAIAETYWHLHTQPRSAFTFEIDLRPYVEKW